MFTLLTPKTDTVLTSNTCPKNAANIRSWRSPSLMAAALTGVLLLTGCQQQTDSKPEDKANQTSEQARAEANKPMPQSDSAAARIVQFQPLYVAQVQALQRRLQAEYESLQAADASDSENTSLLNSEAAPTDAAANNGVNSATNSTAAATTDNKDSAITKPAVTEKTTDATNSTATNEIKPTEADAEINTSTEVGERDLEVLKRISLEPREPNILTDEQIIERYQQAMQALYQPAATPLSAQDSDTLINIATLLPQLFEHPEIAERVAIKSPALARLIVQHQVWQQIEAQQAIDMQQMKLTQQQEFETLMTKFNDTIKDYDEQISKYEQTLKEFQ